MSAVTSMKEPSRNESVW